ncbi:unnamed protein product [Zymoseptoria tritici ST99CH_1A5]|uniref:Cytochrome b5 heme-binding domain-containing protein n=1 Tax=Zymoseptoria tritici ST99CH_1A5 TaxID=1276529 RepID=A0A1Y6LWS6_ZYMTR|nr:unnamed protein product [Zymoseptoria tritici ST99CH_1A5]
MPAELRSRKPAAAAPSPVQLEEKEKPKTLKKQPGPPTVDLEPNIFVIFGMIVVFFTGLFLLVYYKIDNRDQGPVANWVNAKFPFVERALNRPRVAEEIKPFLGANAQSTGKGGLQLTEEELKQYTGEDGQPIYLGIDGKIFDVSASPAFYGPGGHYHHFVGKDATRAWVTECWDEPEQFTWRMDDVEVMFYPKWMDEQLEDVAEGNFSDDLGDVGKMPQDMMAKMAKQAMEKFGKVDKAEKKKRRKTDQKEADDKVQETLQHWVKFFEGNAKYKLVGSVIRDETRPDPPKPCKKAMEKRPMKGGKLEALTGKIGGAGAGAGMAGMFGGGAAAGGDSKKPKAEMPDNVKQMLGYGAKKGKEGAETLKEGAEDVAAQIRKITQQAQKVANEQAQQKGFYGASEQAKESVEDVAESVQDSADAATAKGKKSVTSAKAQASDAAEQVKQSADVGTDKAKKSAASAKAKASDTAQDAAAQAKAIVEDAAQQSKEGAESVADTIKNTAQQAKEKVVDAVYGSDEDEDLMADLPELSEGEEDSVHDEL